MTDEPDSTPPRRPPTIDLKATEVEAEKPAAAQNSATDGPAAQRAKQESSPGNQAGGAAAAPRRSRLKMAAAGAVVIAIVAVVAGLWTTGVIPSGQPTSSTPTSSPPASSPAASTASAPNTSAIDEIAAQLKKLEGAIQARQPDPALGSRLTAAEAAAKSLGDSLATLNRRVDDIAAAAQNALTQAKAASAAADAAKSTAQGGVTRNDIDALAKRIAALESAVTTLTDDAARQTSSTDDRAARLTVVAEALGAAIERGAPFQAELTAVKSFGVDQSATPPLEPFAATGVPSAAALTQELSALAPALRQATEPMPSNASFLQRIEANARKLVRVTPLDAPAGDDPSSVAARINADAAHGDTAAALAAIAKLPDATKSLTASWVQKVEARNAAIAASRRITADALAALGKPNTQ